MNSCSTLTFIILVFETAIVLLVRFAKALQIREGSGSSRTDVTRKELEPARLYRRCNRKDHLVSVSSSVSKEVVSLNTVESSEQREQSSRF
jgi:hypothetical protein